MHPRVARHHQDQHQIARNLIAELHPLWSLLEFHALPETTPRWLLAVRPVVERAYLVSQYTAAQFVQEYRAELFPQADPLGVQVPNPLGAFGSPIAIPDVDTQIRIMVSMRVTGPLHVAHLMPMEEQEAMQRGFSKSTGAAIRIALNGGRGMVRMMANIDPLAKGVAAVADEDACEMCAPLTKPVPLDSPKADLVAVGHDACRCSARIVYES